MSNPATLDEIRAACSGMSSEFVCDLLEREATLTEAMQDTIAWYQLDHEARDKAATEKHWIEWLSLIEFKVLDGLDRREATRLTALENPKLRQALIEHSNRELHF